MTEQKTKLMPTLRQHNATHSQMIDQMNHKEDRQVGIRCNHCDQELVNPYPYDMHLGTPLKIHVECRNCGFEGYAYRG